MTWCCIFTISFLFIALYSLYDIHIYSFLRLRWVLYFYSCYPLFRLFFIYGIPTFHIFHSEACSIYIIPNVICSIIFIHLVFYFNIPFSLRWFFFNFQSSRKRRSSRGGLTEFTRTLDTNTSQPGATTPSRANAGSLDFLFNQNWLTLLYFWRWSALHNCTLLYCAVLYGTVLYSTLPYCAVLYCTILYCTVLYCTVLYCTEQLCDAWCHIIFRSRASLTIIWLSWHQLCSHLML